MNFNVKAGVNLGTTGIFTKSLIEESSFIGTTSSCNASSAALNVIGILGAKIICRDDVNKNLG
ncbi:MAG: hypothetical protein H7282_10480 [Cytophagaceae bacterium]|nr:hypothetical protein [Cytophagaceae bacterium]